MKKSLTLVELKETEEKIFKLKLLVPAFGILLYLLSALLKYFTFSLKPIIILSASLIYLLFLLLTHYLIKKVIKVRLMLSYLFVITVAEVVFTTIIIYYTGGIISNFFVLYLFIVLSVSIYRQPFYPFLLSSISFILYLVLVLGEFYGKIVPFPYVDNSVSFSFLSERIMDNGFFLLLVSFFSHANISKFNKERFTLNYLQEATLELTTYIGEKEKIFKHIVKIAREVVEGDAASIAVHKDGEWKFLVWDNVPDNMIKNIEDEFKSIKPKNLEEIAEKKTATLIKDTYKVDYWIRVVPTRSYIGVPIIVNNNVVAVLNVDSNKPNQFFETNVLTIETLARVITTVFEKDALLSEVRDLNKILSEISREDTLTSLYNRRKLEEILNYEIIRYLSRGNNFQIIFLDFDNFKLINDNLGHTEGDRILKEAADLILKSVRKIDYVFRYGGDEFLILIPNSPPPTVGLIVDRLNFTFRESFSSYIEQFKFGFSYGGLGFKDFYKEFANKNPEAKDNVNILSKEVIKKVDEFLYSSKKLKKML